MYNIVAMHPTEVKEGSSYSDDLSSPILKSVAFTPDYSGEIVNLENGNYAFIPGPSDEPVLIEAVNLIQLGRAIDTARLGGWLKLTDDDVAALFNRAFQFVYEESSVKAVQ